MGGRRVIGGDARTVTCSVSDVLSTIAAVIVARDQSPTSVGTVTLLPHQREGADRIRSMLRRHGGALLCDAVGVGKTYVALAVARDYPRALILAPAVLRDMWRRAIAAADVTADVVSLESLGRRETPRLDAPLVIVDEAHHLRNPATRRYDVAARLCASAHTLLLTATPLHNRRGDLAALVALFAGVRAHAWTDDELATVIVRRDRSVVAAQRMPHVEHVPACTVNAGDEGVLDALIALPPPVPPSDGAEAAALVVHSLVRQWASSNAALVGALRRRIARGRALLAALDDGRHPTRAELREWTCTEDAVQLAFTHLLSVVPIVNSTLQMALERHVSALVAVLRRAESDEAGDRERVTLVHDVCARHAPGRVVAFTSYEETAEMVYRALRGRVRAVLLTARGGVVAGGRLSRAEVLEHFSGNEGAARRVAEHERIDLLVTTDLLSEGVDLLAASVAIHLDLPWTAARLEQRVGRIARVGSRHSVVTAYTLRPSARAESVIRAAEIVRRKGALADHVLARGSSRATAPLTASQSGDDTPRSAVECTEEIHRLLRECVRGQRPECAGIVAARSGEHARIVLVACVIDGAPRLLTVADDRVDSSPHVVLSALRAALRADRCGGQRVSAIDFNDPDVTRALEAVQAWHASRSAALDAGVDVPPRDGRVRTVLRGRRRAIGTADGAVSNASFAQRDSAAARAAALRAVAAQPAAIGLERALFAEATIGALSLPPMHRPGVPFASSGVRVIALLLLDRCG